ncbi:AbiTii domain-containing protein [Microbacterium oleivorans]|uniref:AbiTii domain-containing protein n=1 Tax=Microbacterium oleivorans TaxID=273677 RepID=A0A7D5ESE2_9MICO|nr:hypothetical protein [Microbacterium oleivorans]QLD11905.1 hypothetical protein HW566_09075 [Microbacterium oleivorans]
MNLLDDVVTAASSSTSTPDLLRLVQTLAQHIGSHELRSWARAELTGYLPEHRLPTYRGPFTLPVEGSDAAPSNVTIELRGPLVELSRTAELVRDRTLAADDGTEAQRFRGRVAAGIDPRIALMRLCAESSVVPAPLLRSVDETVRNRALEIALDLRAVVQETADGLAVSAASLAFIVDGALGLAPGLGAPGTTPALFQDAAAVQLVELMSAVLADTHRAEDAARVVLEDETGAVKRNSVQRLANAVRSGRIPAAPGIHPDDAADLVVDIAAGHLGW